MRDVAAGNWAEQQEAEHQFGQRLGGMGGMGG